MNDVDPSVAGRYPDMDRARGSRNRQRPFMSLPARRAGARLLAMILYTTFGEPQPLNRQSESYAREGLELDTSTLSDSGGTCTPTTLSIMSSTVSRTIMC
jgi:hypothetical protein